MKKIIFIIIIAAVIVSLIIAGLIYFFKTRNIGAGGTIPPENPENTEPMDFQFISLTENNCSAIEEVFEIEKTESGVKLSKIYLNISNDERQVVREINGDKTLLRNIQEKLGDYGVEKWDGFHGANPPDILDGSSMSFNCTMSDGRKLSASGSNNFPKNYGAVRSYFYDLLTYETVDDIRFVGECFEITLPESWISNIRISYQEDDNTFSIPLKDRVVNLMRVDFKTYELNDKSKITPIGKIKSKDSDEEIFLSILNYESFISPDECTEEQYKIYSSFKEKDFSEIVDSIKLADGYEFIKE